MRKVFVICPVRNATLEIKQRLEDYVAKLEKDGYLVHYPPRDTDQSDPIGNQICEQNFRAILEADEVHVFYDETSTGLYFDMGGTFMLTQVLGYKKKIVFVNKDDVEDKPGKSFQNVLKFLDEETN